MRCLYCFRSFCRISVLLVMTMLLATTGCESGKAPTYPVKGRVTYPDGSPVTSGMVEFKLIAPDKSDTAKLSNARGVIQEDGSYALTTYPLDGAVAGRHRAIVQEPYPDADVDRGEVMPRQAIATKYRAYNTSGLEFEVKEEENEILIEVTRP